MGNIRKIISVWKYQLYFQICDTKTALLFFLLFFYIRSYTEPIVYFSKSVNVNITPFLFPLFMNDWVFPIIISLFFLVLVCDAPFIKKGYLFLIARTGKLCWAIGQSLFLLTYSALYSVMICILIILNMISRIEWKMEWGKVILTLVRTDASKQFQTLDLSATVVENYSALEALMKTLLLSTLLFWFIGMVIFMFNYIFKNHMGIIVATIFIFFDLAINNIFYSGYYKYSPVSLMKLSVVTGVNSWNPTFAYAVSAMIIGSISFLLIIMIYAKWKKGIYLEDRRQG